MYDGTEAVVDGYAKSLWSAFNGPAGSVAVNALLVTAYVVPALAAVAAPRRRTRAIGVLGYSAGVAAARWWRAAPESGSCPMRSRTRRPLRPSRGSTPCRGGGTCGAPTPGRVGP
jgi:hypothetical protein